MSSPSTAVLVSAINAAIMQWQDATAQFDAAVGMRLDLSTSEMQCLSSLVWGPRPAREVAEATRLTRAAVTTLIDRLEKRGMVRRTPDTKDRRQILISM